VVKPTTPLGECQAAWRATKYVPRCSLSPAGDSLPKPSRRAIGATPYEPNERF
jgi:hypothetical protein